MLLSLYGWWLHFFSLNQMVKSLLESKLRFSWTRLQESDFPEILSAIQDIHQVTLIRCSNCSCFCLLNTGLLWYVMIWARMQEFTWVPGNPFLTHMGTVWQSRKFNQSLVSFSQMPKAQHHRLNLLVRETPLNLCTSTMDIWTRAQHARMAPLRF